MHILLWLLLILLSAAAYFIWSIRATRRPGVLYPEPFHWFWGHRDLLVKNGVRMPDYLTELGMVLLAPAGWWRRGCTPYLPCSCVRLTSDLCLCSFLSFSRRAANQFGKTFAFSLAGKPHTFRLVDPKCLEHILKTNFDGYAKSLQPDGEESDSIFLELFGDGILAVDGQKWADQRKLMLHQLSTPTMKQHMEQTYQIKGAALIDRLKQVADDPTHPTVDMQKIFHQTTMDVMSLISFGVDTETLTKTSTEANAFSAAYDRATELCYQRVLRPKFLMLLMRKYKLGKLEQEISKLCGVVDGFLNGVVTRRRAELKAAAAEKKRSGGESKAGSDETPQAVDLLTAVINDAEEKGLPPPSDRFLRDVVFTVLVGGRDTTASLLTWCFYEMHQHPEETAKLVAEIDRALGTDRQPTVDDMKLLPYVYAFVQETLRLHPAAPSDSKLCAVDDTLPDGTPVRRGDVVAYPLYALGRLPSIWGDDAAEFKPSRFFEQSEPNQFKFSFFK